MPWPPQRLSWTQPEVDCIALLVHGTVEIDGLDLCAHLRGDGGGIDLSAQVQLKKLGGYEPALLISIVSFGDCRGCIF